MFKLNIRKIQSVVQNCVVMSIDGSDNKPLYIKITQIRGEKTAEVEFYSEDLSDLGCTTFSLSNADLDEKGLKKAVFDWFLTEKGTENLKIVTKGLKVNE